MRPLLASCLLLALSTLSRASLRTNWCPEYEALNASNNGTELGLTGRKIVCGATVYPPFSMYDEATGVWSGYDIEVFREVARRGNFEFEIVRINDPQEGETYDSIIFSQGREVDILCTWWGETASRKRRNIEFTAPVIDISFIVMTSMPYLVQPPFKDQFWTFLSPFSRDLWLVLLFGGVVTALFMLFVDPKATADPDDTHPAGSPTGRGLGVVVGLLRRGLGSVSNLFYKGWVLATIQDPYKPSNPWSKLYLMSWTGVLVVLLAAYIAQLTTFLIEGMQSTSEISSFDDVLRTGAALCTPFLPEMNNFLRINAPSLPIVPIFDIGEIIPSIRSGRCAAALNGVSVAELMIASNKRCDIRVTGRTLNFMAGAYAADTSNCGMFVLRVVDAILQGIREDGMLDHMWESTTRLPPSCAAKQVEGRKRSQALSLRSVGGLFIIHAAFMLVAILGFGLQRYRQRRAPAASTSNEEGIAAKAIPSIESGNPLYTTQPSARW